MVLDALDMSMLAVPGKLMHDGQTDGQTDGQVFNFTYIDTVVYDRYVTYMRDNNAHYFCHCK